MDPSGHCPWCVVLPLSGGLFGAQLGASAGFGAYYWNHSAAPRARFLASPGLDTYASGLVDSVATIDPGEALAATALGAGVGATVGVAAGSLAALAVPAGPAAAAAVPAAAPAAKEALTAAQRIAENRAAGLAYQAQQFAKYGLEENRWQLPLPGGRWIVPDSLSGGINEINSGLIVRLTPQLERYIQAAKDYGIPFYLWVRERAHVSENLRKNILELDALAGGKIIGIPDQ